MTSGEPRHPLSVPVTRGNIRRGQKLGVHITEFDHSQRLTAFAGEVPARQVRLTPGARRNATRTRT